MAIRHSWACGRQLARQILANGGGKAEAALRIREHCGVSLLRAHRTAYGYTLAEAAEHLRKILRDWGTPAEGLAHQRISRWENGLDMPSLHYLNALCFLYRTRSDRLGFGCDFSEESEELKRRTFVQGTAASVLTAAGAGGAWGPIHAKPDIEALEERTEQSGYQLYSTDPAEFIPLRMVDMAAAQRLLLKGSSLDAQRRLQRLIARNAGYVAIRMTDVGDIQDTFGWFRIAGRAARQAEDTSLEAWIAGHWSDAYGCYGHALKLGLEPARAAQSLGRSGAKSAAVFGALVEAGLQARLSRTREAREAVQRADRMFNALPAEATTEDGTKITEYFLRWHQSNALTAAGEDTLAEEMRSRALDLPFAARDVVGRGLLHLDRATALVRSGAVDEACDVITHTWQDLPVEFRVGQIPQRIVRIVDDMGQHQAASRSALTLADYLHSVDGVL